MRTPSQSTNGDWDDEPEIDERDDRLEFVKLCHECHHETAGESCGFCGNDLCPACFEMGAGFCSAKHTQDQIDAYEDAVYPPEDEKEAESRKRHRRARNELQALGILPNP